MHERIALCHRMLSEAEQRIREFSNILQSDSRHRTTEIRRPLDLLKTSFRNMDWIIQASSWFEFPPKCIDQVQELKPIIENLIDAINVQIVENQIQRSHGKKKLDNSKNLTVRLEGNGILTPTEIERIDSFIGVLEEAPSVDYVALHKSTKEQRLSENSRMFSEGLSFGEVANAPPILNQPDEEFRVALRSIDNDIIEQIKIIEHCLPRWFSIGEFPPPYYAGRIAVILRKAKEYGRERKFLRAYLVNFRSRLGKGRADERLIERAEKMGIVLPPVR